jgi:hypothetical protein
MLLPSPNTARDQRHGTGLAAADAAAQQTGNTEPFDPPAEPAGARECAVRGGVERLPVSTREHPDRDFRELSDALRGSDEAVTRFGLVHGQVVIRLCRIPTCRAPCSVQQNMPFLRTLGLAPHEPLEAIPVDRQVRVGDQRLQSEALAVGIGQGLGRRIARPQPVRRKALIDPGGADCPVRTRLAMACRSPPVAMPDWAADAVKVGGS